MDINISNAGAKELMPLDEGQRFRVFGHIELRQGVESFHYLVARIEMTHRNFTQNEGMHRDLVRGQQLVERNESGSPVIGPNGRVDQDHLPKRRLGGALKCG